MNFFENFISLHDLPNTISSILDRLIQILSHLNLKSHQWTKNTIDNFLSVIFTKIRHLIKLNTKNPKLTQTDLKYLPIFKFWVF
jgi:hypothetical protein